ncbi:MAG TPA: hypothetical protein DCP31_09150 [Cyanobacteria bacterium UBA8543]|nr:hypothetical protein [Cyanobacteria bacterium UBA8543]
MAFRQHSGHEPEQSSPSQNPKSPGLMQIFHYEPPFVGVNDRSPLLYVVSMRKSRSLIKPFYPKPVTIKIHILLQRINNYGEFDEICGFSDIYGVLCFSSNTFSQ